MRKRGRVWSLTGASEIWTASTSYLISLRSSAVWTPQALRTSRLTGINIPIRIAEATVLPGDIVLGRRGGVIFIPPHFAQQVVEQGEEVALRDRFGHQRLREGVYTPGEIDRKWSEEIEADFAKWRENQE